MIVDFCVSYLTYGGFATTCRCACDTPPPAAGTGSPTATVTYAPGYVAAILFRYPHHTRYHHLPADYPHALGWFYVLRYPRLVCGTWRCIACVTSILELPVHRYTLVCACLLRILLPPAGAVPARCTPRLTPVVVQLYGAFDGLPPGRYITTGYHTCGFLFPAVWVLHFPHARYLRVSYLPAGFHQLFLTVAFSVSCRCTLHALPIMTCVIPAVTLDLHYHAFTNDIHLTTAFLPALPIVLLPLLNVLPR